MTARYSGYSALKIDFAEDRILRVSLNSPERMNALTEQAHKELAEIWRDADGDPDVSVVLVRGEGEHFSAGGEFAMVERMIDDAAMRQQVWREARDLVYNMVNCSKPIVSALQGSVVGGGLAVGLLADISVAARSAKLIDGHVRLGVCAGDHAVLLWPLLCGMAKAKYHLLLNEPLSGEKAEQIGLVSLCVDDAELQETALSIARRLATGAPTAIRWTKYALNNWLRAAGPAFDASLALEMMGFGGSDVREGMAAFREKRPPAFDQRSPG